MFAWSSSFNVYGRFGPRRARPYSNLCARILLRQVAFSRTDRVRSVDEFARREGIDRRSVRRLLPLGFLSPRVVEAIVEGRQPPDLSVIALTRRIDLPLLSSAQGQTLGLR